MRIFTESTSPDIFAELIAHQAHPDYVYMYPPRQSYRPFTPAELTQLPDLIERSFRHSDNLNLYVHVPFCRQICNFCNLYAISDGGRNHEDYISTVISEARRYADHTDRKKIQTLYLGGGTPSLLSPAQLERVVVALLDLFAVDPADPPAETALEVDPATVDAQRLRDIRAAGINRINLGYQSLIEHEVTNMGRRRSATSGLRLLEHALDTGFDNVCVDLIYGLESQTDENWRSSAEQVATAGPQTICAYSLSLRPFTGYQRKGYDRLDGATLYRRYDIADQVLQDAGYRQETHVRWVRDGGGYLQKVNHWALQNVLGLGAGARSYLWEVDLRNGYSVRSRVAPLRRYADSVGAGLAPATEGYLMNDQERRRKAVILNLVSLDRSWFAEHFRGDPLDLFTKEFAVLSGLGLCTVRDDRISLTRRGMKYRDLIAQSLFSPATRSRVEEFSYDE